MSTGGEGVIYTTPSYDTTTTINWPYTTGNVQLWPTSCHGNVHVWACDHTAACLCGVATRVRKVCPSCGQA